MVEMQASYEDAYVNDGIQFELNINTDQLLQEIVTFGQVSCRYHIECKDNLLCIYSKTNFSQLDCNIEGIVQLEDGSFAFIDSSHFYLKWLSQSYKFKSQTDLMGPPTALCVTEAKQVAISLTNKLEVFAIDGEITKVQNLGLQFSHPCRGLAYFNKRYYITDHASSVYIYNIRGNCIQKIQTDSGRNVFKMVRNIAVSKDVDKIYLTDMEKGLITLDMNGQDLSTLETEDTEGAYGVCVTNDGNVSLLQTF